MRTDPISNFFSFLTGPFYDEPDWLHYVYWALALASIAIAVAALRLPSVRGTSMRDRAVDLWRFAVRFLLASFWWQQTLWKWPEDTGGLRYWTGQEVQHSAFHLQSFLVKSVILPVFEPFAYAVYAFEVTVAVTLFLGLGVRLFGLLGAGLIFSLFLGLYRAPQEWPWSYAFLTVLMLIAVVENYGASLGLDAFLTEQGWLTADGWPARKWSLARWRAARRPS